MVKKKITIIENGNDTVTITLPNGIIITQPQTDGYG